MFNVADRNTLVHSKFIGPIAKQSMRGTVVEW